MLTQINNMVLASDNLDTILPTKIKIDLKSNSSQIDLKKTVQYIYLQDQDSIKLSDVVKVEFIRTINVHKLGAVNLFKIGLSYRLPMTYNHDLIMIISNVKHYAYLVALDGVEPIKINEKDSVFYFAGRYKRKLYGTFKVFDFSKGIMKNIFTSPDFVSNYSEDCISYPHDNLKLKNIDLNNDGYLDLQFSGIENFYCKGFETSSREDKKPLRRKKIEFTYYYRPSKHTWQK